MENNAKKTGTFVLAGRSLSAADDHPGRSLQMLRDADLLIFEEAKPARQVLKAAGIHREFLQFSEHGGELAQTEMLEALQSGKTVVYMSDQGMPGVSDPGWQLVEEAHTAKARIRVIPGPSSITAAVAVCPFPVKAFRFVGFPPKPGPERKSFWSRLKQRPEPVVLMDTPYRLKLVLEEVSSVILDRLVMILDVGEDNEDVLWDTPKKLQAYIGNQKRNFVMVLP